MRRPRWTLFASLLLAALALVPAGAHLLELPNKIDLNASEYLTVQQVYRGWAFAGAFVFGALAGTALLAFQLRWQRRLLIPVLIALGCLVATQVVFWTLNFPANQQTQNWVTLPANWEELRQRWEWGHAASAAFNLCALIALLVATMRLSTGDSWLRRRPDALA